MIVVVTPNPALDVTYHVDALMVGEVNRVSPLRRPGGKGVNVVRLLAALASQSHAPELTCTGFLGGATGAAVRTMLARDACVDGRVTQAWVEIDGETRTTVGVVDAVGTVTMLNEAGPAVGDGDWDLLEAQVARSTAPGDVLVVAGSSPPGPAAERLATMLRQAHSRGVRTLVDTSGPALTVAARCGATVLKPNVAELAEATGTSSVADGAAHLLALGAGAVVVSQGTDGMTGYSGARAWRARPGSALIGNPTGAGDAVVTALARALEGAARDDDVISWLPSALLDAVGLSGAAVLAPVAGEADLAVASDLRALAELEEIHAH